VSVQIRTRNRHGAVDRAVQCALESLEQRQLLTGVPLTVSQVAFNGGLQLDIVGGVTNDVITVTKSGSTYTIHNTDGWTKVVNGTFRNILINGGDGNDRITISSSVTDHVLLYGGRGNDTLTGGPAADSLYGGDGNDRMNGAAGDDTLVSIGGGNYDSLTGGLGNDGFWLDNYATETITDLAASESAGGAVHRVSSFRALTFSSGSTTTQTLSRELNGQRTRDPQVTATSSPVTNATFSNMPLFSDAGPKMDDVLQGECGDCWFLATLGAMAKTNPNAIRQSIVDLGDGTYAVQFRNPDTRAATYLRIDNDLPAYSGTRDPAYAQLGADNSLWVALMEKAYTFYRTGAGTYASIEGGWMDEAFKAFGYKATDTWNTGVAASVTTTSGNSLLQNIKSLLSSGYAVTFAVGDAPGGTNLISDHAYTVDAVISNPDGTLSLRLRNPWGVDNYSSTDGTNDGYLTLTAVQAGVAYSCVMSARV
jgi:hypothetical protein